MKILITGASGFIVSQFLAYLDRYKLSQFHEIVLLSSKKHPGFRTILYDSNGDNYTFSINEHFDIVLHAGAWTPKSTSKADSIPLAFSNILFTKRLLESLEDQIEKLVFISTLDIYDNNETIISEKSLENPNSLYGWSKLYCEKMIEKWCMSEDVKLTILRLGHIYGEGEEAYKKAIPIFINNALSHKPIEIFTKGEELRSFLYIKDCLRCIYSAIIRTDITGIFNVASGTSYSILEIARLIKKLSESSSEIIVRETNSETRDYCFDNSKISHYFGLVETSIEEGLSKEIAYLKNLSNCPIA